MGCPDIHGQPTKVKSMCGKHLIFLIKTGCFCMNTSFYMHSLSSLALMIHSGQFNSHPSLSSASAASHLQGNYETLHSRNLVCPKYLIPLASVQLLTNAACPRLVSYNYQREFIYILCVHESACSAVSTPTQKLGGQRRNASPFQWLKKNLIT